MIKKPNVRLAILYVQNGNDIAMSSVSNFTLCPGGLSKAILGYGSRYPSCNCRLLLEKFYIGDLDKADRNSPGIVEYQSDTQEGEFYDVLKRRVEKFFRGNEVTP